MKTLNYKTLLFTCGLILGIILSRYFNILWLHSILFTGILCVILFVLHCTLNKTQKPALVFTLFTFFTSVGMGSIALATHNEKNWNSHYSHYYNIESTKTLYLKIESVLKPNAFNANYIARVIQVNKKKTTGHILLNVSKQNGALQIPINSILICNDTLENLKNPLNPFEFNYKNYLATKHIYHKLNTSPKALYCINTSPKTPFERLTAFREKLTLQLNDYAFNNDQKAIIKALVLGQRQSISPELHKNYVNAGAIHLLAISGLHIGIVFLLLNFVLNPLKLITTNKTIKLILLLLLLWTYGILTGATASVVRACTMFTVIAIGIHANRKVSIYNSLIASIFFILLINPYFLFDIGFQLSYFAVFAIVILHPLAKTFWNPKQRILNYFWNIFTVSMAAQLGVLPLSLYYFHQFPGLFWISNSIIIPFMSLILCLGIFCVLLASINMLPDTFVSIYGSIINAMNTLLKWVASQEYFIFKSISFSTSQLISAYFILISFVLLFKQKSYQKLHLFMLSISVFLACTIWSIHKKHTSEFVIFHKIKHSVIGEKKGERLRLSHDLDVLNLNVFISNYITEQRIKTCTKQALKPLYKINNQWLLVVDSMGVYQVTTFKPHYVLLRQSPKINLNRLIKTLKPKYIIADGSNYKYLTKQWKATCKKHHVVFYNTQKQGAFVLK